MKPRILASILHWNSPSSAFLSACSLHKTSIALDSELDIAILDNGSALDNRNELISLCASAPFHIHVSPANVGFAAGHNLLVRHALLKSYDYILLLNSDCEMTEGSLSKMTSYMNENPTCGASSPEILCRDDSSIVDFAGATHDWKALSSTRATSLSEGLTMMRSFRETFWLAGTALLLRLSALREVGLLDERYFAYFEDNDISVRLVNANWRLAIVPGAQALHSRHQDIYSDRPPYYFYLMSRNAFHFWLQHGPRQARQWVRYRLAGRGFALASMLLRKGYSAKADACVLGVQHGILGVVGPPRLDRRPTLPFRMLAERYGFELHRRIDQRLSHD